MDQHPLAERNRLAEARLREILRECCLLQAEETATQP